MVLEANKTIARRWNGELFGGGDLVAALVAVDRSVAPDYVDHAMPPGLKQQLGVVPTPVAAS